MKDLKLRMRNYERSYETLTADEGQPYIKLLNLSSQLHLNHIYGSVAKSLVPYMMGIHVRRHRLARAVVPLRLAWPSRREAPRHLRPLRARAAGRLATARAARSRGRHPRRQRGCRDRCAPIRGCCRGGGRALTCWLSDSGR